MSVKNQKEKDEKKPVPLFDFGPKIKPCTEIKEIHKSAPVTEIDKERWEEGEGPQTD